MSEGWGGGGGGIRAVQYGAGLRIYMYSLLVRWCRGEGHRLGEGHVEVGGKVTVFGESII